MNFLKNQTLITSYFFKNKDVCVDIEKNEISISIDNNNDRNNDEYNKDEYNNIENKDEYNNNSNKKYGYNNKTGNWHCLECGDNMGNNPRQLCGKSYCYNL